MYLELVPPKCELFTDRLEITSAGVIPMGLSEEDFFKGDSIPQNKELMRVFRDLDLVEQLGSGIPRILQAYSPASYHFSPSFICITFMFEEALQTTMQAIPQAEALLQFCREPKGRAEIQTHLQLKNRDHLRKAILLPLLEAGLLLQTLPDEPTSPKQQFVSAPGVLAKKEEV